MIVVVRAMEYAKGLAAEKTSILWVALDFTRRMYGHPKHTFARYSDNCQCFRSVIALGLCPEVSAT